MVNKQEFKDVTATIIFEGAALNRDEKIGGNIQSIKKMTIGDKIRSFISRPAIRHYLFNTLIRLYPNDWKCAAITAEGDVAQFDLEKDDILTSAELDAFGYMYTISDENSITRKASVGITKAISLFSYNDDISFYANHDLIHRANKEGLNITPNPFQREENTTFYKLSFTIDSKILGEDSLIVNNKIKYNSDTKTIVIELKKPKKIKIEQVEEDEDSNDKEGYKKYIFKNKEIYISNNEIQISTDLSEICEKKKKAEKEFLEIKGYSDKNNDEEKENPKKGKGKNKVIKIEDFLEEDGFYKFHVTRIPKYDKDKKILTIETGVVKEIKNVEHHVEANMNIYKINGLGKITEEEKSNNIYEIKFILDSEVKKRRIYQILQVIHDGLVAHSSGEDNTIIPLFMIAAPVKVPSPIFHSYIDLKIDNEKLKVIGVSDCLQNTWLEENKVYIKDCERLKIDKEKIKDKLYDSWEDFLTSCGVNKCEQNSKVNG